MTPIVSALRRAHGLARHFKMIGHVVEHDKEGLPVGSGHLDEGDAMVKLQNAAMARWAQNHESKFSAMYAVFPDGSRHQVEAPK